MTAEEGNKLLAEEIEGRKLMDAQDVQAEIIDHDADPGDMDGDHESALASAGWGTDESYGGYDERY